jgi:hypothetical protein
LPESKRVVVLYSDSNKHDQFRLEMKEKMPKFKILASREVFYEFEIEADSKEAAEENLKDLVQREQIAKYAYDWAPLEVFDNEKA